MKGKKKRKGKQMIGEGHSPGKTKRSHGANGNSDQAHCNNSEQ